MSWLQITFIVNVDDVERLSGMLEAFLAQAITTENAGEDEFYEVAFPGTPDWKKVSVTALFDSTVDHQSIVNFVHKHLQPEDAEEIPTQIKALEDQDWERVWLSNFKPILVGENLWVCPSWCEPERPSDKNIVLDPGLAFGTGTHATTAMCLDWISKSDFSNQQTLDYGSGSGILAIATLMFGCEYATAVDIDPLAVSAAVDNAKMNEVSDRLHSCLPHELEPQEYPVVIANILADVIIELKDTLLLHLAPGGTLVLTGILSKQSSRVKLAFGDDFEFDQTERDQWCMLIGRRQERSAISDL